MKTGIELIKEERQRQIDVEGWSKDHDKQHAKGGTKLILKPMCGGALAWLVQRSNIAHNG